MKKVQFLFLAMLVILFAGCDFQSADGGDRPVKKDKPVNYANNPALKDAIIKNNIDLEVTGIKLKEAYLVDKNENKLAENTVKVGEYIYLVLIIDSGWVIENDRVFIAASEKIVTSAGKIVVDADDIFKQYESTGVSAEDAKYITLSAVITRADTGIDNFVVHFRVWDKRSPSEIKGKYRFSISK